VLDNTLRGRHRAAARYNPAAELTTIVKSVGQTSVKASAVLAASGGLVAAFALPAHATATQAPAGSSATASAPQAVPAAAPVLAPAVIAPRAAAPVALKHLGVVGVKAVAKPKPKPKPVVKPTTASTGSSAAAPSSSYAKGISARCSNLGLIPNAARVCTAVDSVFHLGTIGGYRANAGEHSTGQATDLMISSRAQGDAVAAFVQAHAAELNVKYVIWRQRYWEPGGSWELMEDRGSPTANHMDHVHVTANY
jgi:hypothetical protein